MPRGVSWESLNTRIVGVTPDGVEHAIDHRVWAPWTHLTIQGFMRDRFPAANHDTQQAIGAFLLEKINVARREIIAGVSPNSWTGSLGSLAAPSHLIHRTRWHSRSDVPEEPFVKVRFYQEGFNMLDRLRDSTDFRLDAFFEHPSTP